MFEDVRAVNLDSIAVVARFEPLDNRMDQQYPLGNTMPIPQGVLTSDDADIMATSWIHAVKEGAGKQKLMPKVSERCI